MLHSQTTPQPTANANPPVSEPERRKRIRELNDLFRRQDQPGAFMLGEFYKTPGIRAMDYVDPKFHKMSDDPSDPQRTVRMLCIYLAEEQYVQ